jgi:outer membrane protein assembly factor BamA
VKLEWDVGETAEAVEVGVVADVLRGPHIRVGRISFQGLDRTRESLLRKRTRFEEGDP